MGSKDFGAAVREARERRGLTQKALAASVPISPIFAYKIEHGDAMPSLSTATAIAKVLDVGMDELTGTGKGEEIALLKAANKRLGDQLHAAQRDLALLDACPVCGWWDGDGCRAEKDVRMGGSCFAWRGAERARLWED